MYVSDVRERLRKVNEFAQKNLKSVQKNLNSAQHRMKVWYDKKARYREANQKYPRCKKGVAKN